MEVRVSLIDIHKARYVCLRHGCQLVANIPRNRHGILFPDEDPAADRPQLSEYFLSAGDFLCPKQAEEFEPGGEDHAEAFGRAQQDDSRDWFMLIT